MNQRIRELIEQATSHMPGRTPYDGLTFDVFDKEKFAELIVGECANICFSEADGHRIAFGEHCGIVIKQHFGVEE